MTIASAPCGTGAPVKMRAASREPRVPGKALPAGTVAPDGGEGETTAGGVVAGQRVPMSRKRGEAEGREGESESGDARATRVALAQCIRETLPRRAPPRHNQLERRLLHEDAAAGDG